MDANFVIRTMKPTGITVVWWRSDEAVPQRSIWRDSCWGNRLLRLGVSFISFLTKTSKG